MDSVHIRHKMAEMEHLVRMEKGTGRQQLEDLKKVEQEKDAWREKYEKIFGERTILSKALKSSEGKLYNLDNSSSQLLKEKQALEEKLMELNAILRSSFQFVEGHRLASDSGSLLDVNSVRSVLEDLLSQFDTLSKESQDSRVRLEGSQSTMASLKESQDRLKERLEKAEDELRGKELERRGWMREAEEGKRRAERGEQFMEKQGREKKLIEAKMASLKSELKRGEKERRKMVKELESFRENAGGRQEEFFREKNEYDKKIRALKEAKEEIEAKLIQMNGRVDSLLMDKQMLESERSTLKKKVSDLERQQLRSVSGKKHIQASSARSTSSSPFKVESSQVHEQLKRLRTQIEDLSGGKRGSLKQSLHLNR